MKNFKRKIVLYGAGHDAKLILSCLSQLSIPVEFAVAKSGGGA